MNFAEIADEVGIEETVRMMVEQLGMTETNARFIIGIESGEIDGDLEEEKKENA